MKISTQMSYAGQFKESVAEIQELEQAGLDTVWIAEAYGFDAPSLMGYVAALTERVQIASGILPIYTRTPTLLAMTAAGIDALSDGRAMLGLGAAPAPRETAHLARDIPANGPREHYMRARLTADGISLFDRQDSSLLSILSAADALIVRPPQDPARSAGETVDYLPLG